MPSYSVSEARNQFPKLLNQMLAGEEVVITRRGKTIAKIVPEHTKTCSPDGPKSPRDMEWIKRHRVTPAIEIDSGELLRQIRDDYRY
jgi:prevent-host-death family protein